MGDRAHLHLTRHPGEPGIWVYAHWAGSSLPEMVAEALTHARPRWTDSTYANRMIVGSLNKQLFTGLVGPEEMMGETGWGIDTEPGDEGDGHRIIRVQWTPQRVFMGEGDHLSPGEGWTFEEFIASRPQWAEYEEEAYEEDYVS